MIRQLLSRLESRTPDQPLPRDHLQQAAAALLATAAMSDGHIDPREREAITSAVRNRFDLPQGEAEALLEEAIGSAEEAVDLHRFTHVVNAHVSFDDRAQILEMLWSVVLADGIVDDHEHALMRQLAGLLHVADRDSALARQRAASRIA